MKEYKRYKTVILAIILLLLLCGCAEKESPTPAPVYSTTVPPDALPKIHINEAMSSNRCTLADENGLFPDWIELVNYGEERVDLSGYVLTDGKDWVIPSLSLDAGEFAVIFCDGSDTGMHSSFSVSRDGETLALMSPDGRTVDSADIPPLEADHSFCFGEDGGYVSDMPTPGFENSEDGYLAFLESRVSSSPLVINEVMTYNAWYMPQNEEYYDWVELKNISSSAVELSDYSLSDSGSERALFTLPEYSLAPGDTYIVFCDGDMLLEGSAPFGLDALGDQLYLSRGSELCDYVQLSDIKYGCSYGRMDGSGGFFHFENPSPGRDNENGRRFISPEPVFSVPEGVYNGVESVSVELSAEGEIHYTTDGSEPDICSPEYKSPIDLTETAVIRAISVVNGKMNSDIATASYIINEDHDLPVVSLVADPESLFGSSGIYSHPTSDDEKLGAIAFFDDEDGFNIDCGIKMHGATSRINQAKKSFKVCFRSRYEGTLQYDLFENGVTQFSSLLIRSAQEDIQSTQIRDVLMHQLAIQCCPSLPSQDYRYCVLYLNGEYWGIYALREAHSEAHYANHYGYSENSVSMWKEQWAADSPCDEIYRFMMNNDMRNDENYNYVAQHIDIESLIAWCIIEAYSGNVDLNSPNVRFYYSSEDDMMRFALVDLDLSMYPTRSGFEVPFYTYYSFSNYLLYLIDNAQFRQQFIEQFSEYIHGPLSDDSVHALIDSLSDEIRSEIPRDCERWLGSLESWEHMLEKYLHRFVYNGTRQELPAYDIRSYIKMSGEEWEKYFGDIA